MKPSSETRLQKLEASHGSRDKRLFVIEGDTQIERDAYIDGLIQSGDARTSDTFIYTGVPRPKSTRKDCGAAPEMRKVHEPQDRGAVAQA